MFHLDSEKRDRDTKRVEERERISTQSSVRASEWKQLLSTRLARDLYSFLIIVPASSLCTKAGEEVMAESCLK